VWVPACNRGACLAGSSTCPGVAGRGVLERRKNVTQYPGDTQPARLPARCPARRHAPAPAPPKKHTNQRTPPPGLASPQLTMHPSLAALLAPFFVCCACPWALRCECGTSSGIGSFWRGSMADSCWLTLTDHPARWYLSKALPYYCCCLTPSYIMFTALLYNLPTTHLHPESCKKWVIRYTLWRLTPTSCHDTQAAPLTPTSCHDTQAAPLTPTSCHDTHQSSRTHL